MMPAFAAVPEAYVMIGLVLDQEKMLVEPDTVRYLKSLLMKVFGVPGKFVNPIWKRLAQHFSEPQCSLTFGGYLKRIVHSLHPSKREGLVWDVDGNECFLVAHAARELGLYKATIYRWIQNGTLTAAPFSYQVKSGIWKTTWAVVREEIEKLKEQADFDERVIELLRKAHKIQRPSAERAYRRLCHGLGIKARSAIKTATERRAIINALQDDPKMARYHARLRTRKPAFTKPVDDEDERDGAIDQAAWAEVSAGHLRLSKAL